MVAILIELRPSATSTQDFSYLGLVEIHFLPAQAYPHEGQVDIVIQIAVEAQQEWVWFGECTVVLGLLSYYGVKIVNSYDTSIMKKLTGATNVNKGEALY